jgi:RNA polymerase-interacting CarD/CdnL/TRCF family regulator
MYMQKLIDTLKSFGIEIPEEKQADVKKALSEHYKNAKEVAKTLSKVEGERDDWKERAETAEETLKSFDGIDPANIQTELAGWKKKAEDAEKEFNAKIYERDFDDALKTALENVNFSSPAAKRCVTADIKSAGLKLKDGKILGLNDLLEQMKQDEPDTFVDESQQQAQQNQARFTTHVGQQKTPGSMTKKDIEAIKDPSERQAAIAQNIQLFQ